MDCRHTFLLGLALMTGVAGCLPQSMMVSDDPDKKKESEIVKHPPSAHTCVVVGDQQASQGDMQPAGSGAAAEYYDNARLQYQQALQIDPKHVPAYHGLARLYLALGNTDQAIRTYTEAVKLLPKDGSLWFELGACHSRVRSFDKALSALHPGLHELDPNSRLYAGNHRGQCLAAAGRYDEAVGVLCKQVGEGKAHYDVAQIAEHNHQDAVARRHVRAALAAEPTNPGALEMLARLDERQVWNDGGG